MRGNISIGKRLANSHYRSVALQSIRRFWKLLRTTLHEVGPEWVRPIIVIGKGPGWGLRSHNPHSTYPNTDGGEVNEGWFAFGRSLLQALVQKPGVYEVADKEGKTIFIGGGKNVRSCLEHLLSDPDLRHVRKEAAMCHVEYRVDYQSHLQFKRMLFRDVFSYDPEIGAGDD